MVSDEPPEEHHGAAGYYLKLDQILWASRFNSARRLKGFFHFIQSDRKVSESDRWIQTGVFYAAPFASRPNDDINLGIEALDANGRSRKTLRISAAAGGPAVAHTEYPLKLYYRVQLTPAVTLSPNLQYVKYPGDLANHRDVMVSGLKSIITF